MKITKIIIKPIILLTFISFVLFPTIAFASWWNPFSWNVWSNIFHKTNTKTQVLENRVKELEKELRDTVATSSKESNVKATSTAVKKTITEETKKLAPVDNSATIQAQAKLKAQAEQGALLLAKQKADEQARIDVARKQSETEALKKTQEEAKIKAEQELQQLVAMQAQQTTAQQLQPPVTLPIPSMPQDNSIELKKILASLQEEVNKRVQQRKQDINKITEIFNKYSDFSTQKFAEATQEKEKLKVEYMAKGAHWLDFTGPMEILSGDDLILDHEYWFKYNLITNRLANDIAAQRVILNKETIENWPIWASSLPNFNTPPKVELFKSTERFMTINTPSGSSNWEITPNGYGGYSMQSYSFGKSMLFDVTPMSNGEYYVNNY